MPNIPSAATGPANPASAPGVPASGGPAPGGPARERIGPWLRWAPGVWLACLLGALVLARIPLVNDDQALFRIGADLLAHGAVLYRDLWDLKQPGIYWFFEAAQQLFGDIRGDAATVAGGVHWLTIGWLATTGLAAAVVAAIIAPYTGAWLFAPLLTLGFYVMRADILNIAQLETLVPLPILGVIACMLAVAGRRRAVASMWFIAGFLTGVVAIFKLMLAAIPLAILLISLGRLGFQRGARATTTAIAAGLTGLAIAIAACIIPFIATGTTERFLWTQFIYPTEALALIDHAPLARLFDATLWIASTVFLVLPAAWIGLRSTLARRLRPRDEAIGLGLADRHLTVRSLGGVSLVAWIVVGIATILLQQLSWHTYHFTMLLWPIGMLAALGAAQIVQGRGPRALLWLVFAGIVVNAARFGWYQWRPLQPEVDPQQYVEALPALRAHLESHPCRSAIVFGSPALLLAARLTPVGELTGQLAPILLPAQWRQLESTLREQRPAYVYLHAGALALIGQKAPALVQWIESGYRPIASDAQRGSWLIPVDNLAAGCR